MIGRPRTFDPDKVLEIALNVFWQKGFESTSMMDLVQATGLHKGSLYKAFGDKKGIFIAAMEMYLERNFQVCMQHVNEAEFVIEGLVQSVHSLLDLSIKEGQGRGCFAMNTMAETMCDDDRVQKILNRHFDRVFDFVTTTLSNAYQNSEIQLHCSVEDAVLIIIALKAGLEACTQGIINIEQAHHLVDVQMSLLGCVSKETN